VLCLTRKVNESIKIGDDIEILVMECKSGSVKLGITVPEHVRVLRSELLERDRSAAVIRGEVKPSGKSESPRNR
jgi:carbon storage regulator